MRRLKVVRRAKDVQLCILLLQPIMTGQLNKHITAVASAYDRVRECDCDKRQAGMSTGSITPPVTPCLHYFLVSLLLCNFIANAPSGFFILSPTMSASFYDNFGGRRHRDLGRVWREGGFHKIDPHRASGGMWGNLLNQAQWPDPSVHVTTITNSPNVQDSSRKLGDGQKGNKQADASHCDLIVPFQGLCNLRWFKS